MYDRRASGDVLMTIDRPALTLIEEALLLVIVGELLDTRCCARPGARMEVSEVTLPWRACHRSPVRVT